MTASRVMLDTSYLITILNKDRANHKVARAFYKHMIENNIHMCISAIAVAEFSVKDTISTLPLGNFIFLPFNSADAIEGARLHNYLVRDEGDDRQAVKDDVKIIGHCAHEEIPFLLTDDTNSMYKYCERLRSQDVAQVKAIPLAAGFDDCAFNLDGQTGFGFGKE